MCSDPPTSFIPVRQNISASCQTLSLPLTKQATVVAHNLPSSLGNLVSSDFLRYNHFHVFHQLKGSSAASRFEHHHRSISCFLSSTLSNLSGVLPTFLAVAQRLLLCEQLLPCRAFRFCYRMSACDTNVYWNEYRWRCSPRRVTRLIPGCSNRSEEDQESTMVAG